MGSHFTGALAYSDDITLLAPCKSALSILVTDCERYASEFDILFNGSKSKLLFIKGRFSNKMEYGIMVHGIMVNIFDNSVHFVDRKKYDYDYDYEITLFEHKQNQHIHIIMVQ